MSDAFAVDLEGLAQVITRMTAFDRAVETTGARIDGVAAALATTWTGAAATSYEDAHLRWRHDLRELRTAVAALRAIASTAHHNYTAAAAANRAMWPG